jgi:hypothetical protein
MIPFRRLNITRSVLTLIVVSMSGCTESAADGSSRVPMKIDRNRVIIPTRVNGSRPLNLILDTGMRFDGVYLFHEDLSDEIDMTGAKEYTVPGAGSGEPSTAMMIESGTLTFGDVTVDSQRVLISKSPQTQTFPTDGVIGWNLFGHYVVEIDYDNSVIYLHDTANFVADSTWKEVAVEMHDDLPFLEATAEVVSGQKVPVTLYIDLASGDALEMLVREDQAFSLPDSLEPAYLGTGLSGDIYGHNGWSESLTIAGYELHHVRTAFAPAEIRSRQDKGDGILGDDVMRRFNVIFDYPRSRLFLRPNKTFDEPF